MYVSPHNFSTTSTAITLQFFGISTATVLQQFLLERKINIAVASLVAYETHLHSFPMQISTMRFNSSFAGFSLTILTLPTATAFENTK